MPCAGKRAYRHRLIAERALASCLLARANGKTGRAEQRIYHCPDCGMWHLTSKPERDTT